MGKQLFPQFCIRHTVFKVFQHGRLDLVHHLRLGVGNGLAEAVNRFEVFRFILHVFEQGGIPAKRLFLLLGISHIFNGHNPLGGALEVRQLSCAARKRRDNLHAGGAGTDYADTFAVQGYVVVPAGAVEHRPFKALRALDIRVARHVQNSGGGDDHISFIPYSAAGLYLPATVDKFTSTDLFIEFNELVDTVLFCRVLEIFPDLATACEEVAPFRVGLE